MPESKLPPSYRVQDGCWNCKRKCVTYDGNDMVFYCALLPEVDSVDDLIPTQESGICDAHEKTIT